MSRIEDELHEASERGRRDHCGGAHGLPWDSAELYMTLGWDESSDLVIVGSGAGSVCAALAAQSNGCKPLIVEKTEFFGGSTAMSGGVLWLPNNAVMKRAGAEDSGELARTYLDACVGEVGSASSHERREAFLAEAPRLVDFLERAGMKFVYADGYSDYHEGELRGALPRGRSLEAALFDRRELGEWAGRLRPPQFDAPVLTHEVAALGLSGRTWQSKTTLVRVAGRMLRNKLGASLIGAGCAVQGRLLQIALRNSVPIRLRAPVQELILQGDRVAGVVVTRAGRPPRRVQARRGVLIDAGGFAHNGEMRERYQLKPTSTAWTNANPGDTGEMIQMAAQLGAAVALMEQSWWTLVSLLPDGTRALHPFDMSKPHCIMVDTAGERYVNESTSYMTVGIAMYERHKAVPAVPSWLIIESRHRNRYRWGVHAPGRTPDAWISSGYMKRADSIEELARKCEIDPLRLRATVERFNGFARRGVDEDYGRGKGAYDRWLGDPSVKPNPNLGAIERPPFYAVRLYPGDVGTCGGLLTDEHARVLRSDGSTIPGLYATGNCTASIFGRSYPGAGASIAGSAVFGFIAARHACGRTS